MSEDRGRRGVERGADSAATRDSAVASPTRASRVRDAASIAFVAVLIALVLVLLSCAYFTVLDTLSIAPSSKPSGVVLQVRAR
jgi:hypothetical protein